MGSAATRRTRAARSRTKPTTGQIDRRPKPTPEDLGERVRGLDWAKLLGRRKKRTWHQPEPGERALRKSIVLAKRRAARERAYANGKRRG